MNRGSGRGRASGDNGDDDAFVWVQCDRCGKWRSAPGACVRGDDAPWFCELNSGRFNASCAAPEDDYPEEEEHKYVVVGGEAEAEAEAPPARDEGGDDAPAAFGRLVLRLKAPRRARAGPVAPPPPEDPPAEEVPPAPAGWVRSEVPRKTVGGSDVYYETPEGEVLRSMPEVARWLAAHRDAGLTLDSFSFVKSAAFGNKPPAGGGSRRPGVSDKLRRIAAGLEEERDRGDAGGAGGGEAAAEHRRWSDACERMQPAMRAVIPALRALMAHPAAPLFSSPEDAAKLPGYHLKVADPIDLGTIRRRVLTGRYARGGRDALLADVRRVFTNALEYHPPGSAAASAAEELSARFETLLGNAAAAASAAAAVAAAAGALRRFVSAGRRVALTAPAGWDGRSGLEAEEAERQAAAAAREAERAARAAAVARVGAGRDGPDAEARAAACAAAAVLRPPRLPAPGDSDVTSDSEEPPTSETWEPLHVPDDVPTGPPARKRPAGRGGGARKRRRRDAGDDDDGSDGSDDFYD